MRNRTKANKRIDAALDLNVLYGRANKRIDAALDLIVQYGGIDGDHHKAWVIDQVTRALTGDGYEAFVAAACAGEDGSNTYSWDTGIAP